MAELPKTGLWLSFVFKKTDKHLGIYFTYKNNTDEGVAETNSAVNKSLAELIGAENIHNVEVVVGVTLVARERMPDDIMDRFISDPAEIQDAVVKVDRAVRQSMN